MQNAAVRGGMGLLGMHPSAASLAHPLHQAGLAGQRMPGLLPLDVRPGLLQPGAAGRFPLLMQQGPGQHGPGLLDGALQAQARGAARNPFPQLDPFGRTPNQVGENLAKAEDEPSGADEGKDQDYRFPPMEKPSTGLLRTPPPEHREPLGGPSSGGVGRPPLLQTPGTQPARTSLVGRLQALAGFTPDNRWNQARGDFDERDSMRGGGGQPPGGPKGFQEERQNFSGRFEGRPGAAVGGAGAAAAATGGPGGPGAPGGPQAWTRGGAGSGATTFDSELHQDLDERRRPPWDRQRDRDERDFDFRRDMNGNRHSRERERERERERDRERGRDRDRERNRDHDRDRERDKERERDRERERGGWTPLLPLPTPLLPTPPLNPNLAGPAKMMVPLKLNPQVASLQQRFQSPLLQQTPSKPSSLLGPGPPAPQNLTQTQSKSPSPLPPDSHHAAEEPAPQTEADLPTQASQNQGKSPAAEPPAQAAESPPLAAASLPIRTSPQPDIDTPEKASPGEPPGAITPVTAATASPLKETSPPTAQEQTTSPQRDSSPEPHWVSRPGVSGSGGAEAEPTPEPSPCPSPTCSPEASPELSVALAPESSCDSLLPVTEPEQQQEAEEMKEEEEMEQQPQRPASAQDVDSDSEPAEDAAASQPELDTVTDTEGT